VDIAKVIADLRSQVDDVSEAIRALERLLLLRLRRSGMQKSDPYTEKRAANPESIERRFRANTMSKSGD
jgi:hypothetical protein